MHVRNEELIILAGSTEPKTSIKYLNSGKICLCGESWGTLEQSSGSRLAVNYNDNSNVVQEDRRGDDAFEHGNPS